MTLYKDRHHCYACYRSRDSCICHTIAKIETQSRFIILMHTKEFRKTKNGTGHMTHLSLPNSELFVGIDFSRHQKLNALLDDPRYSPFLLYPGKQAINISHETLLLKPNTQALFILIDSTWACSKKMIKLSKNLHDLPIISFDTTQSSSFIIKEQPQEHCLSTIETTQKILQLLNHQGLESIQTQKVDGLLKPFFTMVHYQLEAAKRSCVRYKK